MTFIAAGQTVDQLVANAVHLFTTTGRVDAHGYRQPYVTTTGDVANIRAIAERAVTEDQT